MKAARTVLVLAALAGAAAGLIEKKHIFVNTPLIWTEAQAHCRKYYVDLSSIESKEALTLFMNSTANYADNRSWIGLSRSPEATVYSQWSDGTVYKFTNWKVGGPDGGNEHCVTILNGQWNDYFCSYSMPFFCYKWNFKLIVPPEMKTWKEALKYCRLNYIDLISLNTVTDEVMVKNQTGKIQTPRFWTAMTFLDGLWFWANKMPLNNTPQSLSSCPAKPYQCAARNSDANDWETIDCEKKLNFICYD